ncbi:MAG: hypothetical protein QM493_07130 [Sulfurovum sp.]
MKLLALVLTTLLSTAIYANPHASAPSTNTASTNSSVKIYYGIIKQIEDANEYLYAKVDENGTELWISIYKADVIVGDKIGYDKQAIMSPFRSNILKRDFKQMIFASSVKLPERLTKAKKMGDVVDLKDSPENMGIGMSAEKKITEMKPFVKKDSYTVSEIKMWRKELSGQTINLEANVFKISSNIMKMDWVHLGYGEYDRLKSDDLVFTAKHATIKVGDKVVATGKVVVDKDFGFGYFYKVIIQESTFKVK